MRVYEITMPAFRILAIDKNDAFRIFNLHKLLKEDFMLKPVEDEEKLD